MVEKALWYADGLAFSCTGCGKCCTGAPGYVWVDAEEIEAMAAHLNITVDAFLRLYTRKIGGRVALTERRPHYDCVFLRGKLCTVYPVRPKQCKTFPWWKENLSSPEEWQETASRCEGIGHKDAPLVSLEEIEKHKNS